MEAIRIGNDITLRWTIMQGEEKYDLTGRDVFVTLSDNFGCPAEVSWSIIGGIAVVEFGGAAQKTCGVYHLTLEENAGEEGMLTLDSCDAFRLVARTPCECDPDGECHPDCEGVVTQAVTLSLSSEVELSGASMDIDDALSDSSTNPVQNKVITEALNDKQERGDYATTEDIPTAVSQLDNDSGFVTEVYVGTLLTPADEGDINKLIEELIF